MTRLSPKKLISPSATGLFLVRPQVEGGTFSAIHSFSMDHKNYAVFISDEEGLYPPTLKKWNIPLSQFLMIQTPHPLHTWNTALEAAQSDLFKWIFLKTSHPCHPSFLRKLQLSSEKHQSKIFLFSNISLPHWFFKKLS